MVKFTRTDPQLLEDLEQLNVSAFKCDPLPPKERMYVVIPFDRSLPITEVERYFGHWDCLHLTARKGTV